MRNRRRCPWTSIFLSFLETAKLEQTEHALSWIIHTPNLFAKSRYSGSSGPAHVLLITPCLSMNSLHQHLLFTVTQSHRRISKLTQIFETWNHKSREPRGRTPISSTIYKSNSVTSCVQRRLSSNFFQMVIKGKSTDCWLRMIRIKQRTYPTQDKQRTHYLSSLASQNEFQEFRVWGICPWGRNLHD